jgi:hypothetical protein
MLDSSVALASSLRSLFGKTALYFIATSIAFCKEAPNCARLAESAVNRQEKTTNYGKPTSGMEVTVVGIEGVKRYPPIHFPLSVWKEQCRSD